MSTMDDLFETSLDDIEDLPEYADYIPTGHYTCEIVEAKRDIREVDDPENKGKKINADVLQVTYELVAMNEVKKEEEATLIKTRESQGDKPGMRFSETFFFHKDAKKTAEIVKMKYKELATANGWTTFSAMIEGMKGLLITCTITSTKSKKDEERYFINTKNIQPAQ